MNAVDIVLDIDQTPPLAGYDPKNVVHVKSGESGHKMVRFCRVPRGMQSGKSSVAIIAPLADGRHVFIEISMANFEGIAAAFRGAEQRATECDGRN